MNETNTELERVQSEMPSVPMDMSAGAMVEAIAGDLSRLTADEKLKYIGAVCKTVGFNPLTKPFDIIKFQGKEVLYMNKGGAEQLRNLHKVDIEILERKMEFGCLITRVAATSKGRKDEAMAAVSFVYPAQTKDYQGNWKPHPKAGRELEGEDRANAMMKCETKGKRRVTLSICSLGMFDNDVEEPVPVTTGTEVLTDMPTAADRVRQINAQLTEGEKKEAIDVGQAAPPAEPPKPEPVKTDPAPTDPTPAPAPAAAAAPVAPAETKSMEETKFPAAAGDYSLLSTGDQVKAFEAVIARHPLGLDFLVADGKWKKGQPVEEIDAAYREKVVRRAEQFLKRVEAWAKSKKA